MGKRISKARAASGSNDEQMTKVKLSDEMLSTLYGADACSHLNSQFRHWRPYASSTTSHDPQHASLLQSSNLGRCKGSEPETTVVAMARS